MKGNFKILYNKNEVWLRVLMIALFFFWLISNIKLYLSRTTEFYFYPFIAITFWSLVFGVLLAFYELLALFTKNKGLKIDYGGYLSFAIAVMINIPILLNFLGKDTFSTILVTNGMHTFGRYGMVAINALPLIAIVLGIGSIVFCIKNVDRCKMKDLSKYSGMVFPTLGILGSLIMILKWYLFWAEVSSI